MQREVEPLPSAVAADVLQALAGKGEARAFAALLYAQQPEDLLAEMGVKALAENAEAAAAFVSQRERGRHKIRVRPLGSGALLEILNDDMPFLVDSVLGEVQARGLPLSTLMHPIIAAARDREGRLLTAARAPSSGDGNLESYIALYLPTLPLDAGASLVGAISAILDEVRLAVTDWSAMRARTLAAVEQLLAAAARAPFELVSESAAFLKWLEAGNFTFLGMRTFTLKGGADTGELISRPEDGLGILRDPSVHVLRRGVELVAMTPEVRRFFFTSAPLIITKSNVVSRVHRRVHMDYVGVKTFDERGIAIGELRIVGLFTSQAYVRPASEIPLLRHKVASVLSAAGFPPASHDGKALSNILNSFPRDELFQIGVDRLTAWAQGILDLEIRPRVRAFVRVDRFDRFVSALIYVPRDRYNSQVRERIGALLASSYQGRVVAFYPFFPPDGTLVRVQFIVGRYSGATPQVDVAALERQIAEIVRTWSDRLQDILAKQGPQAGALQAKYSSAFSAGYAETFTPQRALEDIRRIERLGTSMPVAIDFYREANAPSRRIHAAVYRYGAAIKLSERLPILENFGFSAIEERSYTVTPSVDGKWLTVTLHDMVIEADAALDFDLSAHDQRLEAAFLAVFNADAENDGYNRLVLAAALDWREVAVLRSYGSYLRQLGTHFTLRYHSDTLMRNAGIARDLIALFHARFDPDRIDPKGRQDGQATIVERIEGALAAVPSLDEDHILRLYLNLVQSTLRTNFYQRDANGTPPATIVFKFDSKALTAAPQPRPFREIWIASPRVEGVHLRFAPIARGGIRWSDRAQDFRTEVLGLVRAQLVKNAVIVPSGAKGGFYPKCLPSGGKRDDVQAEGVAAYRIFITSLLSVTDNIVAGKVVPPERVLRYDGDDAYLVVAADKGTATFSDIANEISVAHGFWLGDAFASGGSAGYDHKAMGITARGAWECVKRHFREMDIDIQSQPFTAVGVGDMSGDVFGNGMLLSKETRLIAAFDHRDIFVDPTPDARRTFVERQRLFSLQRSSWQDFDTSIISKGGGVFSRSAKAIALSPEIKAALDLDAASVTPVELIRAILKARVDLLFFGGIGTYVRASSETDAEAGDKANEALRITGAELRARVVGEGANLGMTQRGRVEFAQRDGRVNTDFIDNSAGVNTSDQEVNIKIALVPALRDGRLPLARRNDLLAAMTDAVAQGALRNNYQQSLALSLAEHEAARTAPELSLLMRSLEAKGLLQRSLEALPLDAELFERARAGRGLTRPELATLLSYAKIALSHELLASDMLSKPHLATWLHSYFPPQVWAAVGDDVERHDLRREIIATGITNAIVNRCGPAFAARMADEMQAKSDEIAAAFIVVREMYELPALWLRLDALDNKLPGLVHLDLYRRTQDLLRALVPWFLRDRSVLSDPEGTVKRHAAGLKALRAAMPEVLPVEVRQRLTAEEERLTAAGVPADIARDIAELTVAAIAPTVTHLAAATPGDFSRAASIYLQAGLVLRTQDIANEAARIQAHDMFDRIAVTQAVETIRQAQATIAKAALSAGGLEALSQQVESMARTLAQTSGDGGVTLARLVVAARQIETVAGLIAGGRAA